VLFLLTFVLVFRDKPLIPLWLARILQLVSLPVAFIVQFALPLWLAVPVMLIGAVSFFMTAIICHRQLYESRPDAGNLTEFYMLMSLGGVMGGLFVSLLAPLVFSTVLEYPILLLLGVIAYRPVWTDATLRSQLRMPILPLAVFACLALYFINLAPIAMKIDVPVMRALELAFFGASAAVFIRAKRVGLAILCMIMLFLITLLNLPEPRVNYRSYFGVSSVIDNGFDGPYRMLNHGTTMHGAQRLSELAEGFKGKPNAMTYFSRVGGIARSVIATQERLASEGKKGVFRVIGLGTGSLSCYSQEGENWAFYEIDHDVVRVASDPNQFTFLLRCAPNMPIIEGDARITLQKGPIEKSDYFLVDAFSSDSIPVHLITVEAMKMYFERINADGVVTMHITNRYMDLAPVVAANLQSIDPAIQARIIDFTPPMKENGRPDLEAMHSIAIVMSRNPKNFEKLDKDADVKPLAYNPEVTAWTDDFADIPSSIMRRLGITKY
jgi:hypothetical protein